MDKTTTYNQDTACAEISSRLGLEKMLHKNTLLKYRQKLADKLSKGADPNAIGPVILNQDDINLIVETIKTGKRRTDDRKHRDMHPKAESATWASAHGRASCSRRLWPSTSRRISLRYF